MKIQEFVSNQIYRATEKEAWLRRIVIFKFEKMEFFDGDNLVIGTNLSTNLRCSLFAEEWDFTTLSPLEIELL